MNRALAFILVHFLFVLFVSGQSKQDLQLQKQKAYDDLKLTRVLMEKTSAKRSSSVKQLRLLQNGINTRAGLISTMESELNLMDRSIEETEVSIGQLTSENKKNKDDDKWGFPYFIFFPVGFFCHPVTSSNFSEPYNRAVTDTFLSPSETFLSRRSSRLIWVTTL